MVLFYLFIALINLMKFCLTNNFFVFGDRYYKQIFGASMGNNLSPVVSCLYMEFFESQLVPYIPIPIRLWARYVDDIFVLFPSDHDPNDFLASLNLIYNSIKFTVEEESEQKLPFLDILVHRTESNFQYSVYRKPTNKNALLHYFSFHDIKIKKSVLSGSCLRAFRVCSPVHLNAEIQFLHTIFHNLGYP